MPELNEYIINIKGTDFKVDFEDKDKVLAKVWTLIHGYAHTCLYFKGNETVNLSMPRLVLGIEYYDHCLIDHINHDITDNRKCNLRRCTDSENKYNRKKTSMACSSKFKGVSWSKHRGYWVASICYNHLNRRLGHWANEHEAAYAYNVGAKYVAKKFAYTNEGIDLTEEQKKQIEIFVKHKLSMFGDITIPESI